MSYLQGTSWMGRERPKPGKSITRGQRSWKTRSKIITLWAMILLRVISDYRQTPPWSWNSWRRLAQLKTYKRRRKSKRASLSSAAMLWKCDMHAVWWESAQVQRLDFTSLQPVRCLYWALSLPQFPLTNQLFYSKETPAKWNYEQENQFAGGYLL